MVRKNTMNKNNFWHSFHYEKNKNLISFLKRGLLLILQFSKTATQLRNRG